MNDFEDRENELNSEQTPQTNIPVGEQNFVQTAQTQESQAPAEEQNFAQTGQSNYYEMPQNQQQPQNNWNNAGQYNQSQSQNNWNNPNQNSWNAQNQQYNTQQSTWNSSGSYNTAPPSPYEKEMLKNKFFKRTCNIAASSGLFMFLGQLAIGYVFTIIATIVIGFMVGASGGEMDMLQMQLSALQILSSPTFLFALTFVSAVLGNSFGIFYGLAKNKIKLKSLFTKSVVGFGPMVVLCIMALGVNTLASYIVALLDYLLAPVGLSVPQEDIFTGVTDPVAIVFMFLTVVVVASITEEVLFRGVILKSLSKYSTAFAAVVSSLLFGLIHGNIPQFVFAFMVGMIMSYITIKTGSIIPAIVIHAFNNFFALSSQVLVSYDIAPDIVNAVYTIVSLACLAFTIVVIIVKAKKIRFNSNSEELRQAENFIEIQGKWKKFFSSGWVIVFIIVNIGLILLSLFPIA